MTRDVPKYEPETQDDVEQEILLDEACEVEETEEILPIPEVEIIIPDAEAEAACDDGYAPGFNAENIIF